MRKSLLLDAVVFILLLGITIPLPFYIKAHWLNNPVSWSFAVVLPISIYLGIRKRKNWKKLIVGSLVFGSLFGLILEYFAHITLAWQVPTSIFPFRILGANTIDAVIGYIPMTLFILIFYEHFFDKDKQRKISPHIWAAIIPALIVLVVITILHLIHTHISGFLGIGYGNAYIKMGVVATIPMLIQIIRFPRLFPKYAMLAICLCGIFFALEVAGVALHYWIFPAKNYLGMVNAFGQTFPLEEIIFWMLLYPPTIASYYEKFIDDQK